MGLKKLKLMSSYIDKITKTDNKYIRPITGKYSFSHKAGLHVNAMLKNQSSYQSISPKKLNRRHRIIIDKYTGRKAIQYRLKHLKIEYDDQLIDNIVLEIKEIQLLLIGQIKKIMQLAEKFISAKIENAKSSVS